MSQKFKVRSVLDMSLFFLCTENLQEAGVYEYSSQ